MGLGLARKAGSQNLRRALKTLPSPGIPTKEKQAFGTDLDLDLELVSPVA